MTDEHNVNEKNLLIDPRSHDQQSRKHQHSTQGISSSVQPVMPLWQQGLQITIQKLHQGR